MAALPHTIGIDARKALDFGIGTYIRNLVRALAELDRESRYHLLVGSEGREAFEGLPGNFHIVLERSPVYSARELAAVSWRLLRLDLDLYHSTHYVLPALVPCRTVVTIHDIIHLLYPEYLPSPLALFYAQRMIRRSLLRGDRIIAASRNTKSDLMEYFGVDGRKIQVIYSGVADEFRRRLPSEELERWLTHLGIRRPYLLFVGNPKPHKNLDNVFKAYARALELHRFEESLICVGDRQGLAFKIQQRAVSLGIADRVRLLGHVAEEVLPPLYQGATLLLYPTLYEGFGLPVIEAMASGVPVITSNTSALKEIAEGYAHLVNPLEVEEIAQAIAHCLRDPEHRLGLAKLGRRRADDFRWDRTAEMTLEIYRSVLARRSHHPRFGWRRGERT